MIKITEHYPDDSSYVVEWDIPLSSLPLKLGTRVSGYYKNKQFFNKLLEIVEVCDHEIWLEEIKETGEV